MEIESTPGHKYYLPESKRWISAQDLKVGDKVLTSDGEYAIIESVKAVHYDTPHTTYNFEVEEFHTYYVGTGICVHNMNSQRCSGTEIMDSVDSALDEAEAHLGDRQHYYKGNNDILVSDADPRKVVRFDLDLDTPHVQRVGQHLNLETYAQPFGTRKQHPLINRHIKWR